MTNNFFYNPEIHHRKSIRIKEYDYTKEGFYFVTICCHEHQCLFGRIIKGEMVLNECGRMIKKWYIELENKFPNFKNHSIIVMPNHIHFIMELTTTVGADLCVCPYKNHVNNQNELGEHTGSPLHSIIQWFKTMSTNEYIRNVKTKNWPPFKKRLWQRNYYEHIIRNEQSYNQIVEYIHTNPLKWEFDKFYRT